RFRANTRPDQQRFPGAFWKVSPHTLRSQKTKHSEVVMYVPAQAPISVHGGLSVRSFRFVLPLAIVLLSSSLFADQIILNNGDRRAGTIEKSDDKSLVIKTEFAGEVTVQWPAIQDIKADQPLHVGLKDGRMVVGSIEATGGNVDVSTKAGEKVEV